MSRTARLTCCRISRQHSAARSTFSRSTDSSVGKRGDRPRGEPQPWKLRVPMPRLEAREPGSGRTGWGRSLYLCSARCSAEAAGTWSDAASPWGSCPSAAAGGTGAGSRRPAGTAALRHQDTGPPPRGPWALPLARLHVLPSEGAQSPLQGETESGRVSRTLGPFCPQLCSLLGW